jgi:Fe-S cluster assembly protein SufD
MNSALTTANWFGPYLSTKTQPVWLQDLQREQQQAFIQRGLPTRKEELWKYTDMSQLAKLSFQPALKQSHDNIASIIKNYLLENGNIALMVFVNGHYQAQFSNVTNLPSTVVCTSIQQALLEHTDLVQDCLNRNKNILKYPFACLNIALMNDGVFLLVPPNIEITNPIHFLFLSSGQENFFSNPRNMIFVEQHSKVTVLEEYFSVNSHHYFTNVVTDICAQENSQIHHYKIQNESLLATHVAQIMVNQKKDSQVKTVNLTVGSILAREDVQINLQEKGAICSANGFYALHEKDQHIDHHVQIDHIAQHGTSTMLYKGVLDKKTHGVFNGMVYVHKDAKKTHAQQVNHNLLLSKEAAIDTKPEFEIYADDVKCVHGGTVGQLNDESLFYLRSRGIDRNEAMKILAHAFSAEVLEQVDVPIIKQRMNKMLNECDL